MSGARLFAVSAVTAVAAYLKNDHTKQVIPQEEKAAKSCRTTR